MRTTRTGKKSTPPKQLWLPCLRGMLGDWIFYSALFPLGEIADRVSYAEELHTSKKLSQMIQRHLMSGRSDEIASYLKTQSQRFFNSMVVAVYEGNPSWHDIGGISSNLPGLMVSDIPEEVLGSFGLLRLTGEERLFAIDGQHRLAGIKSAVIGESELRSEEVSVLLVAHKNTASGLQRTRRLFTTLNKRAVPVSKGEIIALDEDDVMAIIARRLVESHPFFTEDRIAFAASNNLPAKDYRHLTTIGNLYDVLGIIFAKIKDQCDVRDLKYCRPPDKDLKAYEHFAIKYFDLLCQHNPPMSKLAAAEEPEVVIQEYRGGFGGNVLFRPIGMTVFAEAVAQASKKHRLDDAIRRVSGLPQELTAPPFLDVLWDKTKKRMDNQGRALARDLLLHLIGEFPKTKVRSLGIRYAKAQGVDEDDWQAALGRLQGLN